MQKPRAISNSIVIGLIAFHLAIALPLAFSLNIWMDEGSSLYTTQQGFFSAFQNAASNEKQAPLYFWILSVWRLADDSIFFARLFSVFCGIASIALFARFCSRVFEPRAALLASSFFALHPFLIWTSLEIRGYAFVVTLTILLITFFFYGFTREDGDTLQSQIAFVIVAIVSLYTNYYLGFLFAGFFAALIVTRNWKSARDYVLFMLIVAIAFVPLVATVGSQFAAKTSSFRDSISALDAFRTLWHHTTTYMLPGQFLDSSPDSQFATVRVWVVRIGALSLLALLAVTYKKISQCTLILAAIAFAAFVGVFAAGYWMNPNYMQLRHATPLFVPFVLFVASLCSDIFISVSERITKAITLTVGLLVLISFSYSLTTLYPNSAKRGDWARVGAFIQENESPGQPILVFTTFDALTLPYHYYGVNKILPDEKFFEFEQEAAFGTENSLKKQTEFVISEIPADAEMIWLVVNEKCLVTDACRPLENYVHANYTIEKEQEFYLEKLFLLRKKTQ
ncbi:MAG: glycosyltransferase family 39 protein [Chloracidobacterium sp.]|nr:glycosyltransferase family 39 protein [Chloracidobacterium sp.]